MEYIPTHYDCDMNRRMSPAAILKKMQECAGYQLDALGLPYEKLYDEGFVFLVISIGMKFHRRPVMDRAVMFETWPHTVHGARFIRNYRITDVDGLLCEAASNWVLMDPHTKKILRPGAFSYSLPLCDTKVATDTGGKLQLPADMEPLESKTVRYSDVDANGHLNNAKYPDIIMDYAPIDAMKAEPDELYLSMVGEAYPGETIALCGKKEEKTVYIRGEHARGRCFDGILIVK